MKPDLRQCQECGVALSYHGGRGRPPKYCMPCSYKVQRRRAAQDSRTRELGAIHALARQFGLISANDRSAYEDMLWSLARVRSARDLDDYGRRKVLDHLRGRRARGTSLSTAKWRRARVGKLNAMWCMLADHGHVHDRSESAMHTWCRHNVAGLERLEWADAGQLNIAIEKLKQWCLRLELGPAMDAHR